jgi:hypothetical protein
VPKVRTPTLDGVRYTVESPDTLDLSRRAELALNALTRAVVPEKAYATWQTMQFGTQTPYFSWPVWMTHKWSEALVGVRAMCGSESNADVEQAMMQALVGQLGERGLLYYPSPAPDHPYPVVPPGTVWAAWCGRMLLAMGAWHQRDGDPAWLDAMSRMATGLDSIAIRHHDYAFFPSESGWSPTTGSWSFTRRRDAPTQRHFPYTPPDEPGRDQQGVEGLVKYDQAAPIFGLARTALLTGDEKSLVLAEALVRFCLLPSMWEYDAAFDRPGYEHGLFSGHFHGNTYSLLGLLEYALVAGDQRVQQFVRQGYEHARRLGIPRVGWFPCWVTPERFGRDQWLRSVCEGCTVGDMTYLAVKLSEAGLGDYWDDVDHYVRNHMIEHQFIDRDLMAACSVKQESPPPAEGGYSSSPPDMVDRALGSFGAAELTAAPPNGAGCCTGNLSIGMYRAWDTAVREHDGVATINLLLNRAAPTVDVDSWLPYEGRVRVTNKAARMIAIRIPYWVQLDGVASLMNGNAVRADRVGRYLQFTVGRGDVIDLNFAVPEEKAAYTTHDGQRYECLFRGSTLVDITPRADAPGLYPLYRRQAMRDGRHAAIKQVERFAVRGSVR